VSTPTELNTSPTVRQADRQLDELPCKAGCRVMGADARGCRSKLFVVAENHSMLTQFQFSLERPSYFPFDLEKS